MCLILEDLNNIDEFAGKLLLKGGTAINLIAFDKLPRLSVDLDLDFAFNLSKEETSLERERINSTILVFRGYGIQDKRQEQFCAGLQIIVIYNDNREH